MSSKIANTNRYILTTLCFTLLLIRSASLYANTEKTATIKVGEQYSISADEVTKFSEGQKGIIDIRLPKDAEEFIIVGIKPGQTTLLLFKENGSKLRYNFIVKALSSNIPKKENIRLDFYFVELKDGGQYQVGLNWPSSIGADVDMEMQIGSSGATTTTATISGLPLPRLDVLHANNWARISRQATVISANGEQAEFQSGGEVNISVEGTLAAEIRQIPFGTKVKVLPRYDKESGRLEIKINAEVSSLGEGRVPSRTISNIATIVNVGMNQAVVLAGLHAQSQSKNRGGLPFFSQLPVIGTLFGSHGARRENVQNVVFIVPSIVDVVSMDARTRIQDALSAYHHFDGNTESTAIAPLLSRPKK